MSGETILYPKSGLIFFLDFIFIIVSSVGSASMVQFITFNIFPLPTSVNLFIFTLLIYLLRFGGNMGRIVLLIRYNKLFLLITILYFWEILQGLIIGEDIDAVLVRALSLFSAYISCLYMFCLIKKYKTIDYILRPYCYYSLYVVLTISLLVLLILTGIVSPYSNRLTNNSMIADNFNNVYFFPAYLSVIIQEPSVFLDSLGVPMICGLSHEPQLNSFLILPAIILLMYLYSSKKMIEFKVFAIMGLLCILATSFTSIMCCAVVIVLHLLWGMLINKRYYSVIILIIVLLLAFIIFVYSGYYDIFLLYMEVKADFDNAKSSGGVSLGLLDYIISSNSLIGKGIFSTQDSIKMGYINDMGYISSFMIIFFYLSLFFTSLKNFIAKNLLRHVIGLASIYFCLHSLKYGIVLFKYNYMFFILFLLSYSNYSRKNFSNVNLN